MSSLHKQFFAWFLLLFVAACSGKTTSAAPTPPSQLAPPGAAAGDPQAGAPSIADQSEPPSPSTPLAVDLISESPPFRCALAKTLARQLAHMIVWADLERYVDPNGESHMVIATNNQRLIKRSEICSIDVLLPKSPKNLRVNIAGADYPSQTARRTWPPLPLLFLEDVTSSADAEGPQAWRFQWRRNTAYYHTCSIKDAQAPEESVRSRVPVVCEGPTMVGIPAQVVVIEVTPGHDPFRFDVLRASIEFPRRSL